MSISIQYSIKMLELSKMRDKINILYVNATSEIGGADIDLLEICRHIDKGRYTLTVVLPEEGPLSTKFESAGVRLVYLDPAPIKRFRKLLQIVAYPLRFALATINLWRLIRREKPDIVHVNTSMLPAAAFAARLIGVPCVWHVREIEVLKRSRLVGFFLLWCIKTLPDKILVISHAVSVGLGLESNFKVSVIYHGVDTNRFCPTGSNYSLRSELGIPKSAQIVGYVGRLSPIKGLEYLIAAFGQVHRLNPESYLLIVGPVLSYQEYFTSLRQQVYDLGLSEYVVFRLDNPDIPTAIRSMDVLVLPSIVPEGLGIVILEGLASGKAVIATNHGGPVEILADCSAGRLVPPKDANSIAQAILELFSMPLEKNQALSEEARRWAVERFSIERMIAELSQLYESLINSDEYVSSSKC